MSERNIPLDDRTIELDGLLETVAKRYREFGADNVQGLAISFYRRETDGGASTAGLFMGRETAITAALCGTLCEKIAVLQAQLKLDPHSRMALDSLKTSLEFLASRCMELTEETVARWGV